MTRRLALAALCALVVDTASCGGGEVVGPDADQPREDADAPDARPDASGDADPDLDAGADADTDADADADVVVDADLDDPAAECRGIAPSADPAANHATITGCLAAHGLAELGPGLFPVSGEIDLPAGAVLRGGDTWPTISMAGPAQAVVRVHDDGEVAFLRLDGNHQMTVPHASVVMLDGSRAFVHDCHVQDGEGSTGDHHTVGVRFWTPGAAGNRVFRNQIHDTHYGVIFDLHPNGTDNLLEENQIFGIRCDAVTFRGYGRAVGNVISRSGWQCLNPPESPIPGGGFYTLENLEGAEIVGNEVREVCGMPLDLDRASRFVIRDNLFERPGWNWDGHDACGAGATAHLLDISDSVVTGNTVLNDCRHTTESDPNLVMSATGSGVPTDLPSGTLQAVAFMLTHREGGAYLAVGNEIRDNRFVATCAAPAVGLGYFVGRATGYAADGTWSAETTSYFTGNDPFGSNIGSKRCGGNWYAADSVCDEGALEPSCNIDDPQHEGPGHDWARNDGCSFYE